MKKICLCGSTRFRKIILKVMQEGRKIGIKFLFPNIEREDLFPKNGGKPNLTTKEIEKLEQEHLKAIDEANMIYVINPGGYIGEHVKREIKYARERNKKIYFFERTNSKYDDLADGIIPINSLDKLAKNDNSNT